MSHVQDVSPAGRKTPPAMTVISDCATAAAATLHRPLAVALLGSGCRDALANHIGRLGHEDFCHHLGIKSGLGQNFRRRYDVMKPMGRLNSRQLESNWR